MMRQPIQKRIRSSSAPAMIAVILSLPLCAACDEYPTDPEHNSENPPAGNLIPNGSFERNGQATLDTWQVSNSSLTTLAPQAAPKGGQWSLRLQSDGAPSTGRVKFQVPGLKDGDSVRLSAYVRADDKGGGLVGLEVTSADGRLRHKSFASTEDTQWTQLRVTDTLSLEPGDNVWVVLSSPPTELNARAGLFDLVTLERLGK
jgi:Carbohydrate binding domain